MIDHYILLERLRIDYSLLSTVLNWLMSNLSNGNQYVFVNGNGSAILPLKFGIPQGSLLDSVLFTIHTIPLFNDVNTILCVNISTLTTLSFMYLSCLVTCLFQPKLNPAVYLLNL